MRVSLTGVWTFVVQASDGLYSMVTEPQKGHHKDRDGHSPTHQHQHRPPLVRSANYRTQEVSNVERFQTMALNQECRTHSDTLHV